LCDVTHIWDYRYFKVGRSLILPERGREEEEEEEERERDIKCIEKHNR